jgi:hypothetical protein
VEHRSKCETLDSQGRCRDPGRTELPDRISQLLYLDTTEGKKDKILDYRLAGFPLVMD